MTVMITRRTLRRTHLLRPDDELNELFVYCLALIAKRHDIAVHAAVVMSTHEHLIVTDRQGQLPRFLQEFHRVLALAVKVLRKWEGPVWDHDKTSVVELRTPQAGNRPARHVLRASVAASCDPPLGGTTWRELDVHERGGARRWSATSVAA